MNDVISMSAVNRRKGVHQVEERRESILDAAQALFLQHGLEHVSMVDIAEAAGITKVTLYRYFPNRDPMIFEIAARMLKKISTQQPKLNDQLSLSMIKQLCQGMVRDFYRLRDAYLFIGMFDQFYTKQYPDDSLAQAYKQEIFNLQFIDVTYKELAESFPQGKEVMLLLNVIMSFLEKWLPAVNCWHPSRNFPWMIS